MRVFALPILLALVTPVAAQTCLEAFPMLPTPLAGWEISDGSGEYRFNGEDGGDALYVVSRPDPESFPNDQYDTLDAWVRAEEHAVILRVRRGATVESTLQMLTNPAFANMVLEAPLGYPRMGLSGDAAEPIQTVMGEWGIHLSGDPEWRDAYFEGLLRCAAAQGQLIDGYTLPD